jgi:uncharacterized protein YjiS (DUF1127 family)
MPPQQTNPGSESDAAVLGLDLTIVVVKEATDDAVAAARPHTSIAALDDALSAVSTRNALSLLKRYWRAFGEWRQRQSSQTTLHDLSDRELKDIGVTRGEIDHIAAHRAIDALRDSILSRGVV